MIYRFQLFLEQGLYHGNVLEGYRTFLEESFGYLPVHNLVYQRVDAFFGVFRQTTRGGFHGICHHQNGLFLGERIWTRIAELFNIHFFIRMFILVRNVEIFRNTCTMMSADEILDNLR